MVDTQRGAPENGTNAQNTQQDTAQRQIESVLLRHLDGIREELTQSGATTQDFLEKISPMPNAIEFVKKAWLKLSAKQSSEAYKKSIPEETLIDFAKKLNRKVTKQAAALEIKQNDILQKIGSKYYLLEHETESIKKALAKKNKSSLSGLITPTRQAQFLKEVFGEGNIPPTISVQKRIQDVVGESISVASISNQDQILIENFIDTGKTTPEVFQRLWKLLQPPERKNLLNLLSSNLTFKDLHSIDPRLFTKKDFLDIAENEIKNHLPTNTTDEEVEEILKSLEWSEISDYEIPAGTALDFFKYQNGNDGAAPQLPFALVSELLDWYHEQRQEEVEAKIKEEALAAGKTEAEAEVLKKKNPNLKPFDADFFNTLRQELTVNRVSFQNIELLSDALFLSGKEKRVLEIETPDGATEFYQVRANISGYALENGEKVLDNPDDLNVYSFSLIPLDSEKNFSPKHREKIDVVSNLLKHMIPMGSNVNIETEKSFYANNGDEIPNEEDIVPTEEIGYTDMFGGFTRRDGRRSIEDSIGGEQSPETVANLEEFIAAVAGALTRPSLKIEKGYSISIGDIRSKDYTIFKIIDIGPLPSGGNGLTLDDGMGLREEISYDDLVKGFTGENKEELGLNIIENKLDSAEDLLGLLQQSSSEKAVWGTMEVREEKGEKMFDYVDRVFDKEKTKKSYFHGADGRIMEVISMNGNTFSVRFGSNFKEGDAKKKEQSTADWEDEKEYPLQYLARFMLKYSFAPLKQGEREIGSKPVEANTTAGFFKNVMGRLSFYDIFSGGKKFFEELKHHLEHGNHLQEQRVMLGIARKLGMESWNSEWFADYKAKYESEEKSLIEKRIETLNKMSTPVRQNTIRHSLLSNGTHDYDHWTNALCMLEKHGTLYAGALQDLEGSWIYFKRIVGIPLSANVANYPVFQEIVGKIRAKGVDNITEEAVIEEYMKIKPEFPNSQIWRMVKKRVKEGTANEFESGKNETNEFNTLDQRLKYVISKLKIKEYAHAVGGLEPLFDQKGPAWKKQEIPFILAMSRIPERLPRTILEKFIEDMYNKGRIHSPALMFIKDRVSQEKFRNTIRTLVNIKASDPNNKRGKKMKEDFEEMMQEIGLNTDVRVDAWSSKTPSFDSMQKFWEKYGSELQAELTANQGGNIMISKSMRTKHPPLEEYFNRVHTQLGDADILHPRETEVDTPFMNGVEGAGVANFRLQKLMDKLDIQINHGGFSQKGLERALQIDLRKCMTTIRDKPESELSPTDKKEWFRTFYTDYISKIIGTGDLEKFLKNPTVIPFVVLGLTPPIAATQKEVDEATKEDKTELYKLDGEIKEKNATIKNLRGNGKKDISPEDKAKIDALNTEVLKASEELKEVNKKIENEKAKLKQYVAFDPSIPRHQEHFEEQFKIFMGKQRKNTGATITKNAVATSVAGVL